MLRFGSPRTNGARSAEAVPMKRHGPSVGALLFYLDQPNALKDPSVYSNAWQKVLLIGPPPDRGDGSA
jgi:hypothetical protein